MVYQHVELGKNGDDYRVPAQLEYASRGCAVLRGSLALRRGMIVPPSVGANLALSADETSLSHHENATAADLQNRFPTVYRSIEDGETVEETKRGRIVAHLTPAPAPEISRVRMPDFAALRRSILGAKAPLHPSIVQEERDSYHS